jgi:hypothetical protein
MNAHHTIYPRRHVSPCASWSFGTALRLADDPDEDGDDEDEFEEDDEDGDEEEDDDEEVPETWQV